MKKQLHTNLSPFRMLLALMLFSAFVCCGHSGQQSELQHSKGTQSSICSHSKGLLPAADRPELYLPLLQNKRVALLVNQTSMVGTVHLIDFLLSKQIQVKKVFAAEHGVRGDLPDGAVVNSEVDSKTGLPIVSLYGDVKKPRASDLADVDIVVFDIQDVGCRFYTYLSSMHYAMEACAELNKQLVVLDRPNPNGHYIDGAVLQKGISSFVGMHPIPVVHGCTLGELALMINGEGWLKNSKKCKLNVIPVGNYCHKCSYSLPVKPSPNLPNQQAVLLYPSLCFFEATNVSIGRGTTFPFQCYGYPDKNFGAFQFTPRSIANMSTSPLHRDELCHGVDLRTVTPSNELDLSYFVAAFERINDPAKFWKSKRWIELLSGDSLFYQQINNRVPVAKIKESWQPEIKRYKALRKKYLLYPDFE
jgi:uncharacterized protein YbbC (DUF1343 family)